MLIIYFISASLASKNKDIGKEKLSKFESDAGRRDTDNESSLPIINADSLAELKVIFPKGYTKDPHERADENPFNLTWPNSRARRVDPDPIESESG